MAASAVLKMPIASKLSSAQRVTAEMLREPASLDCWLRLLPQALQSRPRTHSTSLSLCSGGADSKLPLSRHRYRHAHSELVVAADSESTRGEAMSDARIPPW